MGLFSKSEELSLGIDIGDSSLKMVELKKKGSKIFLSNYAFSENIKDVKFTKIEDAVYLAQAINKIREEANIKATRVTASLPTFAVFSSVITLSGVDAKNLQTAVFEEAKKVIPLPLEEMKLGFQVISEKGVNKDNNIQVFLTGSPKKLVRKYVDVFKAANLELANLETETFSLIRALLGNDKTAALIVEIGANSTDLSIIKESIPILNRSLEICGGTITSVLAEKLGLPFAQAEQFKFDLSVALFDKSQDELPQLILKTIAPIIEEIEYMLDFFRSTEQGTIEKIILSGGGSLLLNLPKYLSSKLNLEVYVGDPFNRIAYPEELRPVIEEVGPKLAVAAGLALRDL